MVPEPPSVRVYIEPTPASTRPFGVPYPTYRPVALALIENTVVSIPASPVVTSIILSIVNAPVIVSPERST